MGTSSPKPSPSLLNLSNLLLFIHCTFHSVLELFYSYLLCNMTFIYINIQSFVTSNMFPSFLIKSWEFIYYSMFYFLSFIPIFYLKVLGVSPLNFVFYTSIPPYFIYNCSHSPSYPFLPNFIHQFS